MNKFNPFYLTGRFVAFVAREYSAGKTHTKQVDYITEIAVMLRAGALGKEPGTINPNYVRAIKYHRQVTNSTLLDAKNSVDTLLRKLGIHWRAA